MTNLLNPRPERDLQRAAEHRAGLLAAIEHDRRAPRRRYAAPLAAAAAVAVVVGGLAVGAPAFRAADTPAASSPGIESLRVPYQTVEGSRRVLHDGERTLPLDKIGAVTIEGRLAGGWLVNRHSGTPSKPHSQFGVLTYDGSFTPRGPANAAAAVLSPDRRSVAVTDRSRVVVIDLASNRQTATLPVTDHEVIQGWNSLGLWIQQAFVADGRLVLWQPGTSPRPQSIAGLDRFEAPRGTTDRVVAEVRKNNRRCAQVLQPRGSGQFTVLREVCGGERALSATLSPDGKQLAVVGLKKVVDVDSGTSIGLPDLPLDDATAVFEDAKHFVVGQVAALKPTPATPVATTAKSTQPVAGKLLHAQVVARCDIVTGDCQTLLRTETAPGGQLVHLGRP